MVRFITQRVTLVVAFLVLVFAVSIGVWRYGYLQALDQLSLQGEADLALASDRLVGQLERYREFAVLLADHPIIDRLTDGADTARAKELFLEIADKTGALDIMFVGRDGQLKVAARTSETADLSRIDYVRRSVQGALGWGHGVAVPLSPRAFYHAAPAFDAEGQVIGSVIVAAGITAIEDEWRGGFRAVFFTDRKGEVFISNRSDLIGWRRVLNDPGLVPASGAAVPFDSYQTGRHEVWQMGWGPYLPGNALHLVKALPIVGLTGEILMDVAPARRLALLQACAVAALCLAFGAVLFLATERRRTLAKANSELETRVERRTRALTETNAALRREAAEREQAQAALARAQADLVQAGKLSALGQMSAGISHELNQPLMAIRSFAENAVQYQNRGQPDRVTGNLARISDMARRMGRIIQNLRAFSKQQNEPATCVDINEIVMHAREMIAERAASMGVDVTLRLNSAPLWVKGGEVRLGQVFINLMTNALDAMSDGTDGRLSVEVQNGEMISVHVRDTGPGVAVPEKVFDPFYSTKEVGASEGMGLGLSISYGIVKSFGGDMRVRNQEPGALFIVELLPWAEREVA